MTVLTILCEARPGHGESMENMESPPVDRASAGLTRGTHLTDRAGSLQKQEGRAQTQQGVCVGEGG